MSRHVAILLQAGDFGKIEYGIDSSACAVRRDLGMTARETLDGWA
jgi:hypothetical protein